MSDVHRYSVYLLAGKGLFYTPKQKACNTWRRLSNIEKDTLKYACFIGFITLYASNVIYKDTLKYARIYKDTLRYACYIRILLNMPVIEGCFHASNVIHIHNGVRDIYTMEFVTFIYTMEFVD